MKFHKCGNDKRDVYPGDTAQMSYFTFGAFVITNESVQCHHTDY